MRRYLGRKEEETVRMETSAQRERRRKNSDTEARDETGKSASIPRPFPENRPKKSRHVLYHSDKLETTRKEVKIRIRLINLIKTITVD